MGVPGFAKSIWRASMGHPPLADVPSFAFSSLPFLGAGCKQDGPGCFHRPQLAAKPGPGSHGFTVEITKTRDKARLPANSSWRQTFDLLSCQPFVSSALPSTVMRKTKPIYSNKPLPSQPPAPSPFPPDPGLPKGLV